MSRKLNNSELKKVTGGETYSNVNDIRFLYGKGFKVEVHTFRIPIIYRYQFTKAGKITKLGYTCNKGIYSPCYYITCDDADYSGWYDEEYLQDTTYGSWEKIDTSKVAVTIVEN